MFTLLFFPFIVFINYIYAKFIHKICIEYNLSDQLLIIHSLSPLDLCENDLIYCKSNSIDSLDDNENILNQANEVCILDQEDSFNSIVDDSYVNDKKDDDNDSYVNIVKQITPLPNNKRLFVYTYNNKIKKNIYILNYFLNDSIYKVSLNHSIET